MLYIENLQKSYQHSQVLKGVSFHLDSSEIIGLIGASGAGKSTVGRILANLEDADKGSILFNEHQLVHMPAKKRRLLSKDIQMIFQDPYSSLSPRMRIEEIVAEPLNILKLEPMKEKRQQLIDHALKSVSLDPKSYRHRYPYELSGGERQRVGVARAIVCQPKLIIADEPTSMLDTSLRMELIHLIKQLNKQQKIAFIFITHDIALTQNFCNRLIVIENGAIVEEGETNEVLRSPQHLFTKRLIHALEVLNTREAISL